MTTTLPPELSPRGTAATGPPDPGGSGSRRVLSQLAAVLAVIVLVVSVGGWGLLAYYDGKIRRIPGLGDLLAGASDGPLNILVVGADSREGLTKAQRRKLSVGGVGDDTGQRSDTMMLMHVSGDRDEVTVVSLPRDSYVSIPPYTDSDGDRHPAHKEKLNAAYALGGAPLLIDTVQRQTGLTINHYVEVGFTGVVTMVDALDGVDVCVPAAVDDRRSGLELPAGTSRVDGTMALAFARARYIDATADLGRMERQQLLMSSMFQRATSLGVLLNPTKLSAFLDAALSSVTVDDSLSRDDLLGLAGDLQSLKPKNLRFLTVPLSDTDDYVDGVGSVVMWDDEKASQLFQGMADDDPWSRKAKGNRVEVAPSQISVQVLNGSSVSGLAATASDALAARGFRIAADPGNAGRSDVTTTVIQYDPVWSSSVKTLQTAFPDATTEQVAGLGGTFRILVGTEYADPVAVKVARSSPQIDSSSAAESICG